MTRIVLAPVRFVFAATLAVALSFGATQAFAAPADSSAAEGRFCGIDCEWRGAQCVCW